MTDPASAWTAEKTTVTAAGSGWLRTEWPEPEHDERDDADTRITASSEAWSLLRRVHILEVLHRANSSPVESDADAEADRRDSAGTDGAPRPQREPERTLPTVTDAIPHTR